MSSFADYDLILERLANKELWDFPGGVHPSQHKNISNCTEIETAPLPERLYIPIKQHIGLDGEIIVETGDRVLKGQALTKSENAFSVPIHASTSGVVESIDKHVSAHPSGLPEITICIKVDGKDEPTQMSSISNYSKVDKMELIGAICNAGIAGLGGAGFPTHIKTNNVKPLEFLIINGIECEPYISADDRLMREHAWQIRQGIDILYHILQPKQVIVAIEDNKPEALQTMTLACQQQSDYQVISVPTKYPAGGEKQLIQVLTSREVPSDGLPIDVGCLMYNVGTCYAIADAIIEGKPLTQRVVTLTGEAMTTPKNVWALIGTPIKHLLEFAHFDIEKQHSPRIIMGGPMMGFTITSSQVPVIKTTNCILAPAANELPEVGDERGCIRCAACADACPVSLLPQQLYWYSKAKEFDTAQEYNLFDCIECGACAYVCPSEIPLVHYYRQAKSNIRQQQAEKEQSEKARIRFETRKARLEKEKFEREEKHRKAAEARKQAMSKDGDDAKAKIAAALARAKAKKAEQQAGTSAAPTTQDKKDEQQNTEVLSNPKHPDTKGAVEQNKQAKVAAAIARAKAKKEAQKLADENSNMPQTSNVPSESDTSAQVELPEVTEKPEEDKKAKVAAAIARAKAKKAAKEQSTSDTAAIDKGKNENE